MCYVCIRACECVYFKCVGLPMCMFMCDVSVCLCMFSCVCIRVCLYVHLCVCCILYYTMQFAVPRINASGAKLFDLTKENA